MSTKHAELFARLAAKWPKEEVRTRPQGKAQLSYITARQVMNRLDDVIGPENWSDDYTPTESGCICRLTIRLPDGQELTKVDAGGCAGMSDEGDDEKSAFSDAFKRAAVKFGVGRYLYRDGVPQFVRDTLGVAGPEKAARPPQDATPQPARENSQPAPRGRQEGHEGPPTTGKALFTWLSEMGKRNGTDEIKSVQAYGEQMQWPARIVDYEPWQVAEVVQSYQGVTT